MDDEVTRRRWAAAYVLPLLLVIGVMIWPLARGGETLYMRDVLNAHLAMKWSQITAIRQGYFPLIDPWRGGGQPLAGNPNAAPFYPTLALFLWSSPFWALNAHFWIHLLLAPFAFYWLGRRWGLPRPAAWAAAICYVMSGFYLSHLSFYNMIAGATLAPALVAACLGFARAATSRRRAFYAPVIAVLWALLLLGGEPLLAVFAGVLAAAAMLCDPRWAWHRATRPAPPAVVEPPPAFEPPAPAEPAATPGNAVVPALPPRQQWWQSLRTLRPTWGAWGLLLAAVGCGMLLALPQIVEFLRVLPVSFRGFYGYHGSVGTTASWNLWQSAEWLLPMVFGRLDLRNGGSFWGHPYYTGWPPLFPSFYPGLLALALIAAAGRPRCRAAWWAWGAIGAGIFCSLGRYNPAMEWAIEHLGRGALRYPVKFWLPVAMGAALLCGLGFAALLPPPAETAAPDAPLAERRVRAARRRFFVTLGLLTAAIVALWLVLNVFQTPSLRALRWLIPKSRPDAFVTNERFRWSGLCLFSLVVLGALWVTASRFARAPRAAAWAWGAALLAVHGVSQAWLLQPLYPMDAVAPYRVPPPTLDWLPAQAVVVNPDFDHLFGPGSLAQGKFPSSSLLWLERRAFYEMFPFAGPVWGRRYDLNESPEGLDTYLTRMSQGGLTNASDEDRLRLLAAWGVGRVVMERPLKPLPSHARLIATLPSFGQTLYIYEVTGRAPEIYLADRVWSAPAMSAALAMLHDGAYDAMHDAVVPGSRPIRILAPATLRVLRAGPESLAIEVDAPVTGSFLVVQRARLLYSATIDGRPAEIINANVDHNGIFLPPGRHRVRLWIDRTNFHRSIALAGVGAALLPLLGLWGWKRGTIAGR